MHLNASDERGIETIRTNILQFVSSSCLFNNTLKFVILDEVDYMTKNAQQALKNILALYDKNVRFILICNYISKIEKGVQDRLIKLQFNKLPCNQIIKFLDEICKKEKIYITSSQLMNIQEMFHSDIRSMINYLQCNKSDIIRKRLFLTNEYIEDIINHTKCDSLHNLFEDKIYNLSKKFNMDRREIMRKIVIYVLEDEEYYRDNTESIHKLSYAIHNLNIDTKYLLRFIFYNLRVSFIKAHSI